MRNSMAGYVKVGSGLRAVAPFVVLALGASLVSCGFRSREVMAYDLVELAPFSRVESPWEWQSLGTPSAEPFLEGGFLRAPLVPGEGDPFALALRRAEFQFIWRDVKERIVALDMEPGPGVTQQSAAFKLNDAPVGECDLQGKRRLCRLDLPATAQRVGRNRLDVRFSEVGPPRPSDGRRIAARLFGLVSGEPGVVPEGLSAPGAPPPVSVAGSGSQLVQAGASRLSFALDLPPGSVFRFTPALSDAGRAVSKGGTAFHVRLQAEDGIEREAWSSVLSAGDKTAGELAVALPAKGLARLTLEVAPTEGGGDPAWGVWQRPRVTAESEASSLQPQPTSSLDGARAEELRASLSHANVVFVLLDAARARSFGVYGRKRDTTPEIDRIARDGVVFERAYTPAVFTLAAMSSVWTSQQPDRHHNGVPYDSPLPHEPLTLAELLSANGVKSAGLVTNSMAGPAFGLDRGFEAFQEVRSGNPEVLGKAAADWLDSHPGQRFFLYTHFIQPHMPYDPPAPFNTRFGPDAPLTIDQRRGAGSWVDDVNSGEIVLTPEQREHLVRLYEGNLAWVDREVGRLREKLTASGLWDNTLFILAGDHGEALYEHRFLTHNGQVYDESAHIPLILRFPSGKGPRGVRVAGLVDLLDIAPTVADVFGLSGRGDSNHAFAGRSLLPVVLGAPGNPSELSRTAGERSEYAFRDGRYTYILRTRGGREELFDLNADPDEMHDLAGQRPIRAAWYRQWTDRRILTERRGPLLNAKETRLTPEQRENLKALGYIK
jgi:arylsulfatase A-like enzyme